MAGPLDDPLDGLAKLARATAAGNVELAITCAEAWLRLPLTVYLFDAGNAPIRRGARPPIGERSTTELTDSLVGADGPVPGGGRDVWVVPIGTPELLVGALEIDHPGPSAREARDLEIAADLLCAALRQPAPPRRLGELAATTAHELNNLISAIVGRAQLLRRAVVEPVTARSLEVIEQAALDGSSLVRRIAGRVSSPPGPTLSLPDLARETVERAETRLIDRPPGAAILVTLELNEARATRGDAVELRQVLTNLLYNAIDAMPRGGRLLVRTGGSGGQVWFEVADTGVGMDPDTRRRMFEPFFTTKGSQGTGIGLSVSREIVERHGGRFEVSSAPGEGTRIRVVLPAASQSVPPSTPPTPSTPTSPSSPPRRSRARRILLIDDDRAVREVLAEMLRSADYQVVEVETGAAGLAALAAGRFDLIFTDLGMPDMNGWEVAARVRAEWPETVVGIITGWDLRAETAKLAALGVGLVIPKPFRLQQVLDRVAETLDG